MLSTDSLKNHVVNSAHWVNREKQGERKIEFTADLFIFADTKCVQRVHD